MPVVAVTLFALLLFKPPQPNKSTSTVQANSSNLSQNQTWSTAFHRLRQLDWLGAAFLVCTVTCFIVPLSLGGYYWMWSSPQFLATFAVSLVSLISFIFVEKNIATGNALIPTRLVKNHPLVAAWAGLFLLSIDFTSFLYYMYAVGHQNSLSPYNN